MIPIRRPPDPPKRLHTKGQAARNELCALVDSDAAYRSGAKKLPFEETLWKEAKENLKTAQHDKCAFCESKVSHIADGEGEHYRPKGGFQQDRGDSITSPGYYWLAYEWTNFLFSCAHCNQVRNYPDGKQRGKGNLFPLRDAARRVRSHLDDLAKEEPLLVNPAQDDPFAHLTFNCEVAQPLDDRGKQTIDIVGLDRPALEARRREKYFEMLAICQVVQRGALEPQDKQELCDWLRSVAMDTAEFAGMARVALRRWGL